MNKELEKMFEKNSRKLKEATEKSMNNLKLITKQKKIEKIRQAIMGWNLSEYGNETTDFMHSNLYLDTTDKKRIVLEKPGVGLSAFRMVYIYEDGHVTDQKETYEQYIYKKDGEWERVITF